MAKRVVLIKHEDSARDDWAAAWLAENGFELDWRGPYAGDGLDGPDGDVAGTVLQGGPQSIPDLHLHPYLGDEARWVDRCIGRGIPTLGLCLGGQVVAHALGARIGPRPDGYHEFGYYKLFPTEEGRSLFPEELTVAQAHVHEFAIPDGAVLLAGSELLPRQAFRYGEKAYAFQFHPETTRQGFGRWQDADWAPWDMPGVQSREEQDALAAEFDQIQDLWFRNFLERLFGPGRPK